VKELQKLDVPIKAIAVNNSCEVVAAVKALASKVDLIYIPSDNTVWTKVRPFV